MQDVCAEWFRTEMCHLLLSLRAKGSYTGTGTLTIWDVHRGCIKLLLPTLGAADTAFIAEHESVGQQQATGSRCNIEQGAVLMLLEGRLC